MKKVFLLFCFSFYFGFSIFGTAQTTDSFVGKSFHITGEDTFSPHFWYYYLEFKNDTLLALYSPSATRSCGHSKAFSNEEREYIELKYTIQSDSIIIKADEYMALYESIDLELIKKEFRPSYKRIKRLCDSALIITKSRELEITYLANNDLNYFEESYLLKQPNKLVIFENDKFSVYSYKEDKKVNQILSRIKREEEKAGKELYLVKEYNSQEAFFKFGIVVNESILYIEKITE
jgi:hypothetical protein